MGAGPTRVACSVEKDKKENCRSSGVWYGAVILVCGMVR